MPTYEYECLDCGYHFDAFQSMLEEPYTTCPTCRGKVKRLISSGSGLIFKGSGFYITDYKKKETAVQGPVKNKTKGTSGTENTKSKDESKTKSESKSQSESKKD